MKFLRFAATLWLAACAARAHDLSGGDPAHPQYDRTLLPPTNIVLHFDRDYADPARRPAAIAALFAPFAPKVRTHSDDAYFYVESDGLPAHPLMVGITAWQRQVPLPQNYTADNAWRFPLQPAVAAQPLSAKTHFFRGAIAIAVNGVPIFNPIKNDGVTDTYLAGELDQFGGHAGRADDYHYHTAPLHLQPYVGSNNPIAFALDGYPIYGLNEPDGPPATGLDEFNGHSTPGLGYHYHASKTYPYLNGGFHGQVTERGGQVDPQPRAQPIRAATYPLPGATITGFQRGADGQSYTIVYQLDGQTRKLHYGRQADSVRFDFIDPAGQTISRVYSIHGRMEPAGDRPPREDNAASERDRPQPPPRRGGDGAEKPVAFTAPRTGAMTLTSAVVQNGGALPVKFTGDGAGISPPVAWSGEPAGTKYFAVIMHHFPGPGDVKWYWTLYNIPATVHSLPENSRGIGTFGNNSVNRQLAYAPPHSKGPGAKTYILTVYALAGPVRPPGPAAAVSRNVLLTAMQGLVLDSAELRITYDRTGVIERQGGGPPPRE